MGTVYRVNDRRQVVPMIDELRLLAEEVQLRVRLNQDVAHGLLRDPIYSGGR